MRSRLNFTLNEDIDILSGTLRGNPHDRKWIVKLQGDQSLSTTERELADRIIEDIKDGISTENKKHFEQSEKKYAVIHVKTETRGAISEEQGKWILRLHHDSVPPLKTACEAFVSLISKEINKDIAIAEVIPPINIVEDGKRVPMIDGYPLARKEDRTAYATAHKSLERRTMRIGFFSLLFLLAITFPWHYAFWWVPGIPENPIKVWGFSVLEKMVGSVTVATLLATLQFHSFRRSLSKHSIKWEVHEEGP